MLRKADVDPVTSMRLVGYKKYRTTLQIHTYFDKKNMEGAEEAIGYVFGKVARNKTDPKEGKRKIPEKLVPSRLSVVAAT